MSIESEIFTLFNEEKRKIEKGIERTLKGTVVDLAGNTPFDTGYHAMNWQLKNYETESTIGVYNKKNKRGFQQVLDMVSNRADKFEFSFNNNPNAAIFNNGKKIDDLEAGRPTAGTGPNANPGFMKAIENSFSERLEAQLK